MNHGTTLQRAVGLMRSGNVAEGVALCRDVLREVPGHAGALHLLALAARDRGDAAEAETLFRQCLAQAPRQAGLLVDFGTFLRSQGRAGEAESLLRQALSASPDFVLAWHGLGMLLRESGRLAEAADCARRLVTIAPRHAPGWELLAAIQQSQGSLEHAIATCRRGLAHTPESARLHYSLGQLLRQDFLFDEAAEAYAAARRYGFDTPDLYRNQGEAAFEAGDSDRALATFAEGVQRFPDDAALQRLHARFRWEYGTPDDPLGPLWQTARQRPRNAALWHALVDLLNRLERYDESRAALAEALASGCDRTPELAMLEALETARIDSAGATACFDRLVKAYPGHEAIKLAFAEHLLGAGDPARAEALCAEALQVDPLDQYAWALRGTAWQMLGDAREGWLLDYAAMVMPIRVLPPEGYASAEAFFCDVQATLEALHRTQAHPIEQTVRGGTQTNGFLFRPRDPVLRALEEQIRAAIRSALPRFRVLAGHPYWGRRAAPTGDGFRFTGAWSVRLKRQGFHTNHMHPDGWISSALYVALPREVSAGTDDAGCIQFGVPPFRTCVPLPARRVVRPSVGELVLFPSYMWHGTVPFASDEPRITVAFDVVPTI
jgi:Tfp pilus assembly protein PilF